MSELTNQQFKTVGDAIVEACRKANVSYVKRYSRFGSRVRRVKLWGCYPSGKELRSIKRRAAKIAKDHDVIIKIRELSGYSCFRSPSSLAFYISEKA